MWLLSILTILIGKVFCCPDNYEGTYCNITTCYGVYNNFTEEVCNGHGSCIIHDQCNCNEEYFGDFCNITTCNDVFSNSSVACSGHGSCSDFDTCQCVTQYYGDFCSVTGCLFDVLSNDTSACSEHGTCFFTNECECDEGYFGTFCNITSCFGKPANETESCGDGIGTCEDLDECVCRYGYRGLECEIAPVDTNCYGLGFAYNEKCLRIFTAKEKHPYAEQACYDWGLTYHGYPGWLTSSKDLSTNDFICSKLGETNSSKAYFGLVSRTDPIPLWFWSDFYDYELIGDFTNWIETEDGDFSPSAYGCVLFGVNDDCLWEALPTEECESGLSEDYICAVNYTGDGNWDCSEVHSTNSSVCNFHGSCMAPDLCDCHEGWTGPGCEIAPPNLECFGGGLMWGDFCYAEVSSTGSRDYGRELCYDWGIQYYLIPGNLSSIIDHDLNEFLCNIIKNDSWIGLDSESGSWKWEDDSVDIFDYSNWLPGYHDEDLFQCAVLRKETCEWEAFEGDICSGVSTTEFGSLCVSPVYDFYCYELVSTDPEVCNGHGVCHANDSCLCNQGYLSEDCSFASTCPGGAFEYDSRCFVFDLEPIDNPETYYEFVCSEWGLQYFGMPGKPVHVLSQEDNDFMCENIAEESEERIWLGLRDDPDWNMFSWMDDGNVVRGSYTNFINATNPEADGKCGVSMESNYPCTWDVHTPGFPDLNCSTLYRPVCFVTWTKCDGIQSNMTDIVCNGHGDCVKKDECVCLGGYQGEFCQTDPDDPIGSCPGDGILYDMRCMTNFSSDPNFQCDDDIADACSQWGLNYHGVPGKQFSILNLEMNNFVCNPDNFGDDRKWIGLEGFVGYDYEEFEWKDGSPFSYSRINDPYMNTTDCPNPIYFDPVDCDWHEDFENGQYSTMCYVDWDTNVYDCFGFLSSNTEQVCSGHGKCVNDSDCYCNGGHTGPDCSVEPTEILCEGLGLFFEDRCYRIYLLMETHDVAESFCNDWGTLYHGNVSELASLPDQTTNDFLTDRIEEDSWIGITSNNYISWGWLDENDFNDFKNWDLPPPLVSEGLYGYLQKSDGKWIDCDNVELLRHFVCSVDYLGYLNWTCDGVSHQNEDDVCNGHGYCTKQDYCDCTMAWSGEYCDNPPAEDISCPSGYFFNGHCHSVLTQEETRVDSQLECIEWGYKYYDREGKLVKINNVEENYYHCENLIDQQVWIGLTSDGDEAPWRWNYEAVVGELELDFFHWDSNVHNTSYRFAFMTKDIETEDCLWTASVTNHDDDVVVRNMICSAPFDVNIYYCDGILSYEIETVCNGQGRCIANETCDCFGGYTGDNCEVEYPEEGVPCEGRGIRFKDRCYKFFGERSYYHEMISDVEDICRSWGEEYFSGSTNGYVISISDRTTNDFACEQASGDIWLGLEVLENEVDQWWIWNDTSDGLVDQFSRWGTFEYYPSNYTCGILDKSTCKWKPISGDDCASDETTYEYACYVPYENGTGNWSCYGYPFYDANKTCSGHGECLSTDYCECRFGYTGETCDVPPEGLSCPGFGFVYQGKCYKVFTMEESLPDAEEECEKFANKYHPGQTGYLASVLNLTANDLICSMLENNAWFGLGSSGIEWEFQDGEPHGDFYYWNMIETDLGPESCAYIDKSNDCLWSATQSCYDSGPSRDFVCAVSYSGDGSWECSSFLFNDTNACNGNGKCMKEDLCECEQGWTGSDCDIAPPTITCEGGGRVFNDTCYRYFNGESQNIDDAEDECSNFGDEYFRRSSWLGTIPDQTTNDFLCNLMDPGDEVWIGLSNSGGNWIWDDGTTYDFRNWAEYPHEADEYSCVVLEQSSCQWIAKEDCDEEKNYLCSLPNIYYDCFGFSSNDTDDVCGGHGVCFADNECDCVGYNFGDNCTLVPNCPGNGFVYEDLCIHVSLEDINEPTEPFTSSRTNFQIICSEWSEEYYEDYGLGEPISIRDAGLNDFLINLIKKDSWIGIESYFYNDFVWMDKIDEVIGSSFENWDAAPSASDQECVSLMKDTGNWEQFAESGCDNTYYPTICSVPYTTCSGKAVTDPDVCNSHGKCVGLETCECSEGYSGQFCTVDPPESLGECAGDGLLYDMKCITSTTVSYYVTSIYIDDACEDWGLNNHGYKGELLSIPNENTNEFVCENFPGQKWIGYSWDSWDDGSSVTFNNIYNQNLGVGQNKYFFDNEDCKWHQDTGRFGYHTIPVLCYVDYDTTIYDCYGTDSNSSEVCSSHGTCIGTDHCYCRGGYHGNQCQSPPTDIDCEGKGILFKGYCFLIHEKLFDVDTYDECEVFCNTWGTTFFGAEAHLAYIQDQTTLDFLVDRTSENFWIGLKSFGTSYWEWEDGSNYLFNRTSWNLPPPSPESGYSAYVDVSSSEYFKIYKTTDLDGFVCSIQTDSTGNWTCFNISRTDVDTVCYGHGECLSKDLCSCLYDWKGENCTIPPTFNETCGVYYPRVYPDKGKCYRSFGAGEYTRREAQNYCADWGYHHHDKQGLLVSIPDSETNDFLCNNVMTFGDSWIGLESIGSGGVNHDWTWNYLPNEPVVYKWFEGDSDADDHLFGYMDTGLCKWIAEPNDVALLENTRHYYTCQVDYDPTTQYCLDIPSTSDIVCSGHGKCIGTEDCDCVEGYDGDYCETPPPEENMTCPGYGFVFQEQCLRLITYQENFQSATFECEKWGEKYHEEEGELVTVATRSTQDFLCELLKKTKDGRSTFIGLQVDDHEWEWQGLTNFDFSRWGYGDYQPNEHDCGYMEPYPVLDDIFTPFGYNDDDCKWYALPNEECQDPGSQVLLDYICAVPLTPDTGEEYWECGGIGFNNDSVCSGHGDCTKIFSDGEVKPYCECYGGYHSEFCEKEPPVNVTICPGYGFIFDGNCYKLITMEESFPDAKIECERWGILNHIGVSELAKINDRTTNDFLSTRYIKDTWIGLESAEDEDYWDWIIGGENVEFFTYWDNANRDANTSSCAYVDVSNENRWRGTDECDDSGPARDLLCSIVYTGDGTWTCYGDMYNESFVCSSHGICKSLDRCVCRDGYRGDQCSYPPPTLTCEGEGFLFSDDPNSYGNCISIFNNSLNFEEAREVCNEWGYQYYRRDANLTAHDSLTKNDFLCSRMEEDNLDNIWLGLQSVGGNWNWETNSIEYFHRQWAEEPHEPDEYFCSYVDKDTCEWYANDDCEGPTQFDFMCELPYDIFNCFGFTSNDSASVCSGRGVCMADNLCDCNEYYSGFDCSDSPTCPGNGYYHDDRCFFLSNDEISNPAFGSHESVCSDWGQEHFGVDGQRVHIRDSTTNQFLCDIVEFNWGLQYGYIGLSEDSVSDGPFNQYWWDDDHTYLYDLVGNTEIGYNNFILGTNWKGYSEFWELWEYPCIQLLPYSCEWKQLEWETCVYKPSTYMCYVYWTTCDSFNSNDTESVCNGHGDCIGFDTCDCKEGYTGQFCEYPPPESILGECAGEGVFYGNRCITTLQEMECNEYNRLGHNSILTQYCEEWGWNYHGIPGLEVSVIDENMNSFLCGEMLSTGKKWLGLYFNWASRELEWLDGNSYGYDMADTVNPYMGYGRRYNSYYNYYYYYCDRMYLDPSDCKWKEEYNLYSDFELMCYVPFDTTIYNCFGKPRNDTVFVCSGHGDCIGYDICECTGGYTGSQCEISPDEIECEGRGVIFKGRCYKLFERSESRTFATTLCDRWGEKYHSKPGYIASIPDQTTNDFFCDRLNMNTFIGPLNDSISDEWIWEDGYGSAISYQVGDSYSNFQLPPPDADLFFYAYMDISEEGCKWEATIEKTLEMEFICYVDYDGDGYWECGGIGFNESSVCSNNGDCVAEDFCECYGGYQGTTCSVPPPSEVSCYGNGYKFEDQCIKFIQMEEAFPNAEKECKRWAEVYHESDEGHLISILDQTTNDFVCRFLMKDSWIGLASPNGTSQWEWLRTSDFYGDFVWWDPDYSRDPETNFCVYMDSFYDGEDQTCKWRGTDKCSNLVNALDYVCTVPFNVSTTTWECGEVSFKDSEVCSGHGHCLAPNLCECFGGYVGGYCTELPPVEDAPCEGGGFLFNGTCYKLFSDSEERKTRDFARKECKDWGNDYYRRVAYLTSIPDQTRNDYICTHLKGDTLIGLTPSEDRGNWTWEDGTHPYEYRNWREIDHLASEYECVLQDRRTCQWQIWNDCEDEFEFMCSVPYQVFNCHGIDSNFPEVCSSHGVCVDENECSCSGFYSGSDCSSSPNCPGNGYQFEGKCVFFSDEDVFEEEVEDLCTVWGLDNFNVPGMVIEIYNETINEFVCELTKIENFIGLRRIISVDQNYWKWQGTENVLSPNFDFSNWDIPSDLDRYMCTTITHRDCQWQQYDCHDEEDYYLYQFPYVCYVFYAVCDGYTSNNTQEVCSGHGECVEDGVCVCREGYSGEFCETNPPRIDGSCEGEGVLYDEKCIKIVEPYYSTGECNDDIITECIHWGAINHLKPGRIISITSDEQNNFYSFYANGSKVWIGMEYGILNLTEGVMRKVWMDGSIYSYDQFIGDLDFQSCGVYLDPFDGMTWKSDVLGYESLGTLCYVPYFYPWTTCYGIFHNDTDNVCNEHGECLGMDRCQCDRKYFGINCNITTCNDIMSNETDDVCNGIGECRELDNCTCHDPGYSSEYFCEYPICYSVIASPSNFLDVCSGHGECIEPDNCDCLDDYSQEDDCSILTCHGVPYDDLDDVCTGHGECLFDPYELVSECICDEGYGNETCNKGECFGRLDDDDDVCAGHGECQIGECVCEGSYLGARCDEQLVNDSVTFTSYDVDEIEMKYYARVSTFREFGRDNLGIFNITFDCTEVVFNHDSFLVEGTQCWFDTIEYEGFSFTQKLHIDIRRSKMYFPPEPEEDDDDDDEESDEGRLLRRDDDDEIFPGINNIGDYETYLRYNLTLVFIPVTSILPANESAVTFDIMLPPKPEDFIPPNYPSVGGTETIFPTWLIIFLGVFTPSAALLVCLICCCCCFICCSFLCPIICSVCCCSGFLIFRQKKKLRKFEKLEDVDLLLKEQELDQEAGDNLASIHVTKHFFKVKMEELKLLKVLGTGGSEATVYKADWNGTIVAFKSFKTRTVCGSQTTFDEFEKEANLLASVSHPNIIAFYGCSLKPPRVGFIMEFGARGDMQHYYWVTKTDKDPIDYYQKLTWLYEIAAALTYLHSRRIIHRDMKLENVLLDEKLICKVMDFGLSKFVENITLQKRTRGVGTSIYMAPEVTRGDFYSELCDIYSYAIMMYIIVTENMDPYDGQQFVEMKVSQNPYYRPKFKGQYPDWLVSLTETCWDAFPTKRKSFLEIQAYLKKKMEEYKESQKKNIDSSDDSDVVATKKTTKVDIEIYVFLRTEDQEEKEAERFLILERSYEELLKAVKRMYPNEIIRSITCKRTEEEIETDEDVEDLNSEDMIIVSFQTEFFSGEDDDVDPEEVNKLKKEILMLKKKVKVASDRENKARDGMHSMSLQLEEMKVDLRMKSKDGKEIKEDYLKFELDHKKEEESEESEGEEESEESEEEIKIDVEEEEEEFETTSSSSEVDLKTDDMSSSVSEEEEEEEEEESEEEEKKSDSEESDSEEAIFPLKEEEEEEVKKKSDSEEEDDVGTIGGTISALDLMKDDNAINKSKYYKTEDKKKTIREWKKKKMKEKKKKKKKKMGEVKETEEERIRRELKEELEKKEEERKRKWEEEKEELEKKILKLLENTKELETTESELEKTKKKYQIEKKRKKKEKKIFEKKVEKQRRIAQKRIQSLSGKYMEDKISFEQHNLEEMQRLEDEKRETKDEMKKLEKRILKEKERKEKEIEEMRKKFKKKKGKKSEYHQLEEEEEEDDDDEEKELSEELISDSVEGSTESDD